MPKPVTVKDDLWISNGLSLAHLALPWIAVLIVAAGASSGLDAHFAELLPFGQGQGALGRVWFGLAGLFLACSTVWAYAVHKRNGFEGWELFYGTFTLGVVLGGSQLGIAACIFSFGFDS